MGHHILTGAPRTPLIKHVVALIGEGAGAPGAVGVAPGTLEQIASATIDASERGLQMAMSDEGVAYSLYLMAKLAQSSSLSTLDSALVSAGLPAAAAGAPYTVFDLVAGYGAAVDEHIRRTRAKSDISEMAHLAASESLSALCSKRAESLFGVSGESIHAALRGLSTKKGFATLAHEFMARFTRRYLEYP